MQSICESTIRIFMTRRGSHFPFTMGTGYLQGTAVIHVPSVRFRRKPSWLGFAKSKEFRVPAPKNWPKSEVEELYLLTQHHLTYMKSLRVFQEKIYQNLVAESLAHATEISEEAEFGKLEARINADNAIVYGIREKALIEEWKKTEQDIIAQRTLLEAEEATAFDVTGVELKHQMERLKSAIREEDVDTAIKQAIDSITDHNFGIDRKGNFYFGRQNSDVVTKTFNASLPQTVVS